MNVHFAYSFRASGLECVRCSATEVGDILGVEFKDMF